MSAVLTPFVVIGGDRQYAGDVIMFRHRSAEPGYWRVALLPADVSVQAFFGALLDEAFWGRAAVVDDFGSLVPVELPA